MLSALSVQAEVDELKGELEEEQFLSLISAPVAPPSQLASRVAPGAAPEAASEAALGVEELKAMLATARKEARVFADAAAVASGSIGGLRALVTELECKLEEKATKAQADCEREKLQERGEELKEKPEVRLDRVREQARAAREEARVARKVARVSTEAKLMAIGTIKELRSLVAELEYKLEAAHEVDLRRTAIETQVGWEDHAPRPGTPRPTPDLVRSPSLLDDVYEALIEVQIEKGQSPGLEEQEQQMELLELTESETKPVATSGMILREQMVAQTKETRAALKIQAVARGWSGRTDYKLVRDIEACRQWVAYHVSLGEYEEAERLGWDGKHPSPLSKRELEANVMNEYSVDDDEPLIPVRDSAPQATQRPPRYRRTRSANTAVRASPLAIRDRSSCIPATSMPAKGCHSPEYRQQDTPEWLRSGELSMRAAVTVQPNNNIDDISALSRSDPHQDMIELVRDVEACRQWVAYHVARSEYTDAVELGWDGTNPPASTEQGLLEGSPVRPAKDGESPRSVIEITAHVSPAAQRGASIEVVARSPVNPQQVMIEIAADISQSRPVAFIAAVEAAAAAATVEAAVAATAEVEAVAKAAAVLAAAEAAAGRVAEAGAAAAEKAVQKRVPDEMVDVRPVNLKILERQASFLKSAKENERIDSPNDEASARVNERLERARKHNKQVARLAAASTTVGRRARGHLTRVRLRREREAARVAELQRETERAWAKTLSRPAPNGRRGKLTRRQHVLEREAANAYFNLGGLAPRDSEVAKHARLLASAITQRRATIEERIEGIQLGTVVVVDPRVTREDLIRERRMEVSSSLALGPTSVASASAHNPQPNPWDSSQPKPPITLQPKWTHIAQVTAPQLRGPPEMSAAVQARREEENMATIAKAKRLAEIDANGSSRLAASNDRGPRTASTGSEYKHAENAKASMPDGLLKGGAVDGSMPGVTDCNKRQSQQSCASSASIEEEEEEKVGEPKAGVPGASPQGGTAGSNAPADKNYDSQQKSATSTSGRKEEWQRARDQATGRKYFWNLCTNEVRWFTAEEEGEAEQGEEQGWERVLDQTTSKEYFWHNVTDEVRWTEPPELAVNRAAAV